MIDLEAELGLRMRGIDRAGHNTGRKWRKGKHRSAPLGLPDANEAEGAQVPVHLSRNRAEPLVLVIGRNQRQVTHGPNVRRIDLVRPAPYQNPPADLQADVTKRSFQIALAQIPGKARVVWPKLNLGPRVHIGLHVPYSFGLSGEPHRDRTRGGARVKTE